MAERVEAVDNSQVARLEAREQEEVLRLKTIRSPFDGVVMERQHHPGEMARSDDQKPILKLACGSAGKIEDRQRGRD